MTFRPVVDQRIDLSDKVRVLTWEDVEPGDECEPVNMGLWADASVHIYYKSGSGSTITLKGTNDKRGDRAHPDHANADFQMVKDADGNIIETTSNAIYQKVTNTWFLKPEIVGGSGVVDISVHMVRAG